MIPGSAPKPKPKPRDWKYIWWCVIGTLTYFVLSSFVIKAINRHVQYEFNTNSDFVEKFYFRIVYFTKYISLQKFVFYSVMNVIGTTFVGLITLQNKRKNPFLDQHYKMDSFYKTLFIVNPAMFFITFNVNLRGAYDLKSYCAEESFDTNGRGTVFGTTDPMMQMM